MAGRATPEWTDFNGHDPGITLLHLFAWSAIALGALTAIAVALQRRRRSIRPDPS